jgi:hypothetical protein
MDSLLEIIKEKDILFYKRLVRLFNTESKLLKEYYPDKIYLEMINKEYLWQSKIFLQNFNPDIFKGYLY